MTKQLTNLELDTLREIEEKVKFYEAALKGNYFNEGEYDYYEGKYNAWLSARSLFKGYLARVGFDLSGTYS